MNFTEIEKIIKDEFDILDIKLEQCKDVSTNEKNSKYYEYKLKIIDCEYSLLQKLLNKYYENKEWRKMLNQVILVGKIEKIENNLLILKVHNYTDDEYDIYIKISLSKNINNGVKEYCNINDTIGVKGKLDIDNKELIVKAEKVTFLSSKGSGYNE